MTVTEMFSLKAEIRNAINHLDEWMKPEHVKKDIVNLINTLYIQREPLGVVCIISIWNYPVVLLLQPLTTAIAADVCTCVHMCMCICVCASVFVCVHVRACMHMCMYVFFQGGCERLMMEYVVCQLSNILVKLYP